MCGIFGIWGVKQASEYVYLGLHNLQHRGQETCGIVSLKEKESEKKFSYKYGKGIVNDVFHKGNLDNLDGFAAIGHVRYSTQGGSSMKNAQPLLADTSKGEIAIAHNGQIANHNKLREGLKKEGFIFGTSSDSEIPLHQYGKVEGNSISEIMKKTFSKINPSYSIIFLTKNEMIGIKDPSGNRPLAIGYLEKENAYVLSSESVAFDIIGAIYVDEVKPGEMVIINNEGIKREQILFPNIPQKCIFEYIYFSRPDSYIFGENFSVSEVQKEFGRQLWEEHPVEANVVIPVPDSAVQAAMGYSEASGIPFDVGLIRSHYIGRTFIEPTQTIIEGNLVKKFNVNRSAINGKKIILIDDSIIRGNTMKKIIQLLRRFGAKEIHLRISSPPYINPCYLGIETSDKKRLIARQFNFEGITDIEKINDFLGSDSLEYLSKEKMLSNRYLKKIDGGINYCTYCFDGKEIIPKE